jgi:hypothetical protein
LGDEFFAEMVAGWAEILDNLARHFNEAMYKGQDTGLDQRSVGVREFSGQATSIMPTGEAP